MSDFQFYKSSESNNNEYHAERKHFSSTNLKYLIAEKPSMYDKGLWGRERVYNEKILGNREEQKENNAFTEGSLAHCLILEKHLLDVEFAVYPGFRKAGKEFIAFKTAEQAGLNRDIVSKSQFKKVESWVKGYEANQTAVELIKGGEAEPSLFGELNGVPIKVRADYINVDEGYIADVKTTSYDTDLDSFKQTVDGFQYELSGALYAKMFEEYYGKPFRFLFIVLGKKDRSCEVYELSESTRKKGNDKVNKALKVYKQCIKSGIWKNPEPIKKLEIKTYNNYEILKI